MESRLHWGRFGIATRSADQHVAALIRTLRQVAVVCLTTLSDIPRVVIANYHRISLSIFVLNLRHATWYSLASSAIARQLASTATAVPSVAFMPIHLSW